MSSRIPPKPLFPMLATLLFLAAGIVNSNAQTESPPAIDDVLDLASQGMAERLLTVDLGGHPTLEDLVLTSRASLSTLSSRLKRLGIEELLSLAPKLADATSRSWEEPHLNAMARYEACKASLEADFAETSPGDNSDRRLTAAMGPTYLDVTLDFLGRDFLNTGGDPSTLESFRARPAGLTTHEDLLGDENLLESLRQECHPVMETLFGADEG